MQTPWRSNTSERSCACVDLGGKLSLTAGRGHFTSATVNQAFKFRTLSWRSNPDGRGNSSVAPRPIRLCIISLLGNPASPDDKSSSDIVQASCQDGHDYSSQCFVSAFIMHSAVASMCHSAVSGLPVRLAQISCRRIWLKYFVLEQLIESRSKLGGSALSVLIQ